MFLKIQVSLQNFIKIPQKYDFSVIFEQLALPQVI